MARGHRAPAGKLTHTEWQAQVVRTAKLCGWRVLHVRKTIGGRAGGWVTATSIVGWPDLFCFHKRHGTFAIELKVPPDEPTAEQLDVLRALTAAGVPSMVAYPSDGGKLSVMLQAGPRGSPWLL